MRTPNLQPFTDVTWPDVNHRYARAWLERHDWTECGEGDWATVLRSPDGTLAARVSPFEPSYGWFLELCRRIDGNTYLPRVYFVSELEGGGQIAVQEYLTPTSEADANEFLLRWKGETAADAELRRLRTATGAFDAECRETVPYWMGIDLDEGHVLRAADGQIKVIDLVGLGGGPMVEQIDTDIEAFFRVIPRHRCLYMLDIPHFAQDYAAEDRQKVSAAFTAYDEANRQDR